MEKHLKDRQYYIDLYDKHTVEKCRSLESRWKDGSLTDKEDGEITKQARKAINDIAMDYGVELCRIWCRMVVSEFVVAGHMTPHTTSLD